MAMVLNNNASMMTLGELNKNISKVGKDLKKVSTGMKINGAGDDASGYSISEKMQSRIRSLAQDEANVQTGMSMLKIASGGIESIIEELRSLKELAINAANDSNTDLDRVTIQREFDQRRANIDSIAVETNYNGKILLMGDYGNKGISVTSTYVIPGTPGTGWLNPTDPDIVGPTDAVVHSGAVEPAGTSFQIIGDNYVISQNGVYELTSAAHNITIDSGIRDVKFVQASGAVLTNVHITGTADGNANIWIENLNITNDDKSSFITFQGADNILNFKGTNNIQINDPNFAARTEFDYAVIHVGEGLIIEGGTDGTGAITFEAARIVRGALIGSNCGYEGMEGARLVSPITVNSGTYTSVVTASSRGGALVGSGAGGTIGELTVNGGTFNDTSYHDVTIGGGSSSSDSLTSECGNITIRNATVMAPNKGGDPAIGNGAHNGSCGNIYVVNSKINVNNESGAGIGTSIAGNCGDITVENTELILSSITGAGIGTGENGHAGNITVDNCNLTQVVSQQGEYVGRGVNGIVGTVTINGTIVNPGDPANLPGGSTPGSSDQIIRTTETKVVGRPLIILDGTRSNQSINFYINDMRTSALKGRITDDEGEFCDTEDINRLRNLSHDPAAYKAYTDILREADGLTLEAVSVTTQHGASVAMRVLDGAIQYALDEATTVGAYISRLEYTADNIVVDNENTVASESTIRDADMAKEMTEYTKSNVLAQAAQSMLAQSNQTAANVLNLLQ